MEREQGDDATEVDSSSFSHIVILIILGLSYFYSVLSFLKLIIISIWKQ